MYVGIGALMHPSLPRTAKDRTTGTHMPYGITQCYLPPGKGDIPAFTPAKLVLDSAIPERCKAELT